MPHQSTTQRNYSKDHKRMANEFNQFPGVWAKTPSRKIKEMATTATVSDDGWFFVSEDQGRLQAR